MALRPHAKHPERKPLLFSLHHLWTTPPRPFMLLKAECTHSQASKDTQDVIQLFLYAQQHLASTITPGLLPSCQQLIRIIHCLDKLACAQEQSGACIPATGANGYLRLLACVTPPCYHSVHEAINWYTDSSARCPCSIIDAVIFGGQSQSNQAA